MAPSLPPVPKLKTVIARLPLILPEGIEHRNYCIRDMGARTIWVMLYAGAVDGLERWIRPSQITDMSSAQAKRLSPKERDAWYRQSLSQKKERPADAWYAPNSREPIRDETIRQGLIPSGAVVDRKGLAVTSSLPRYALERGFAGLFDETLDPESFVSHAESWRAAHLSKQALARLTLLRKGAAGIASAVSVKLPSGEMRNLAPGLSSVIAKAVIEEFAPRFLIMPALLWLSESGNKVIESDNSLAKKLGLMIDASKALPDIILADLGPPLLVVFVEVVATDGPVNQLRKGALTAIAVEAGFDASHLAFLTAFEDRSAAPARALLPHLAWGTFAWFRSEPDKIVVLRNGKPEPISNLR